MVGGRFVPAFLVILVGLAFGLLLPGGGASAGGCPLLDPADPGPYQPGWQQVTIARPDDSTFTALLFYPAASPGQGAPYDGGGAPYPAISFGHGWLITPPHYQSTLGHLATWGYLVVATESYTNLFPNHQLYADDMRHCLTYLEVENADAGSWLYQQVDVAHLGLSGHSMGGGASVLAAAADPRVRAVVTLAAAETNPSAIAAVAGVAVPVRLVGASDDAIAPVASHTGPIYDNANPPRQLPLVEGGWHCGFMDYDIFGCDSGPLDRAAQLAITRRLLTETFNLYLKGDQSLWRPVWGPERDADPLVAVQADSGIGLAPASQVGAGMRGSTAAYNLTLTNAKPQADSYTLFAEDNAWVVTFPVSHTATLAPGESLDLPVEVHVPAAPASGEDTALVSVRSDRDGGTRQYAMVTTHAVDPYRYYLPLVVYGE
ncbi:MAG: dienelactone hydrolase family protein [Anaerolineae bacterium]|nr:dienelactone hydrolase family protein [Anaerolineae bacterium]